MNYLHNYILFPIINELVNASYLHLNDLYITIAALSAKICPQNLPDFSPGVRNSTPIIASVFMRIHIASPRPLCVRFLLVLCFLRQKMVDFIVLSIKLLFMVLGVSYSRVIYNN